MGRQSAVAPRPAIHELLPTIVLKQMILLLTYCQKVNNSLTLHHKAYVIHLTSSCHVSILSFHIITAECPQYRRTF